MSEESGNEEIIKNIGGWSSKTPEEMVGVFREVFPEGVPSTCMVEMRSNDSTGIIGEEYTLEVKNFEVSYSGYDENDPYGSEGDTDHLGSLSVKGTYRYESTGEETDKIWFFSGKTEVLVEEKEGVKIIHTRSSYEDGGFLERTY